VGADVLKSYYANGNFSNAGKEKRKMQKQVIWTKLQHNSQHELLSIQLWCSNLIKPVY